MVRLRSAIVGVVIGAVIAGSIAYAQKSNTQLQTEVNTNFANNTTGAITPSLLRTTVIDILNSILTANGCPTQVLGFGGDGVTPTCYGLFSGALGSISVKVRSTALSTTLSAGTDYFICLDPTSNALTVNLPTPTLGLTFLVKDCTGQSQVHNIVIVPLTGNIDGLTSSTLSLNFSSEAVTYTGTQWSVN